MRVLCNECGSKSVIRVRKNISVDVTDLYCICSSPECGHSFVMSLSFKHTLSPSKKTNTDILKQFIHTLSDTDKKELITSLSN